MLPETKLCLLCAPAVINLLSFVLFATFVVNASFVSFYG